MEEVVKDTTPWYALRIFGGRALKVKAHFEEKGLECFVPMCYRESEDAPGKLRKHLVPVVNNLLFIKKTMTDAEMQQMVSESGFTIMVITKSRENKEFCEIPAKQMEEFQLMCNPDIFMYRYLTPEEAKLKIGSRVLVKHGPLKGLTGRLVRQSHKYFLLKEMPGMGVMLKVTKWCCVPLEE